MHLLTKNQALKTGDLNRVGHGSASAQFLKLINKHLPILGREN